MWKEFNIQYPVVRAHFMSLFEVFVSKISWLIEVLIFLYDRFIIK